MCILVYADMHIFNIHEFIIRYITMNKYTFYDRFIIIYSLPEEDRINYPVYTILTLANSKYMCIFVFV